MRLFWKSLAGLTVTAILAVIIVAFIAWSRVPDMLADHLSEKMGVSVHIDDMHASINSIKLEKLEIGNPKNSLLAKAFTAEEIVIKAPIFKYLDKAIVIEEIEVNNIYLGLEFDSPSGTKGNWTRILNNLQQSGAGNMPAKKSVLIKKIVFTNISTDLVYRQGNQAIRRLPLISRMELENISSEGEFPTDQIANSVLGQMLKSIFVRENLKNMLESIFQNPTQTPGKLIDTFKGLFGG